MPQYLLTSLADKCLQISRTEDRSSGAPCVRPGWGSLQEPAARSAQPESGDLWWIWSWQNWDHQVHPGVFVQVRSKLPQLIDPVLWDEIWKKVQNYCYFCTATLRTFLWRVKTKSSWQLQFDKQTIVVDDFYWVFIRKLGMRRSLMWYFLLLRLVLCGCRARKLI